MGRFKPATRKKLKARIALCGPAGSGKTFTALRLASALGGRIAILDTEHASASYYLGSKNPDGGVFAFDVDELNNHNPQNYIDAIRDAGREGYDVLIIDSLSHAWSGRGGALEMVDNAARKNRGNSYVGWRDVTPLHNAMIDAILSAPCHVICTMRSKMAYILEENHKGKKVPVKVGMAPVQRDGMEYEFTVVADIDTDHRMRVSKSRCSSLADYDARHAGGEFAGELLTWLDNGEDAPPPPEPKPTPAPASEPEEPEDAPPRTEEHPSWAEDRKRFHAYLGDVGRASKDPITGDVYAKLKAFCVDIGRPEPKAMTQDQRDGIRQYLDTAKGRRAVNRPPAGF